MLSLSELESDALGEIMNIGIGRAARALSEMVDQPINMNIPSVAMLPVADACAEINKKAGGMAYAVKETFAGTISGDALLVFPERDSFELVRHLIGEDSDLGSITEMEQDALLEVGNVILTSCTISIMEILGTTLDYTSLPEIIIGNGQDIPECLRHSRKPFRFVFPGHI